MPGSNSYAFEVTLSWTTMHMGAADWATLHSHSKPVRSPISRDQRSLRFGGTWNCADVSWFCKICVAVNSHRIHARDSNAQLRARGLYG